MIEEYKKTIIENNIENLNYNSILRKYQHLMTNPYYGLFKQKHKHQSDLSEDRLNLLRQGAIEEIAIAEMDSLIKEIFRE